MPAKGLTRRSSAVTNHYASPWNVLSTRRGGMTKRLNKVAVSSPERAKTRLAKNPPTRLAENQAPTPSESQAQTVIPLPRSDPTVCNGHGTAGALYRAHAQAFVWLGHFANSAQRPLDCFRSAVEPDATPENTTLDLAAASAQAHKDSWVF